MIPAGSLHGRPHGHHRPPSTPREQLTTAIMLKTRIMTEFIASKIPGRRWVTGTSRLMPGLYPVRPADPHPVPAGHFFRLGLDRMPGRYSAIRRNCGDNDSYKGCSLDTLTVSVLASTITSLLNSTAGEAGKTAWEALSNSTRRLLGGKTTAAETSTALDLVLATANTAALPAAATHAAQMMLTAAAEAPEYADFLNQWNLTTGNTITNTNSTMNTVTGGTIQNLIQAQTVYNASQGG